MYFGATEGAGVRWGSDGTMSHSPVQRVEMQGPRPVPIKPPPHPSALLRVHFVFKAEDSQMQFCPELPSVVVYAA